MTGWTYLDTLPSDLILNEGVLALVSEADSGSVPTLQSAARERQVDLLGAIVPGLVIEDEFRRRGTLLVPLQSVPRVMVPVPEADHTPNETIEALADFVLEHAAEGGGDTLMLLVDATIADVASILARLYMEVGDQVNYAGVCVGSETFEPVPCLFDVEAFQGRAILALLLPEHPGATLAHGYRGNDALWVATATQGSKVETIEGRPAFEVYQELLSAEYGIQLDRENFYRHAVHFPFAINRAQGEALVRIPVQVCEDGSVHCSGEIAENALLSVVRAVEPGNPRTAAEVGAAASSDAAGSLLTFYCAGRYMHLDQGAATKELEVLRNEVAPLPVVGALCLGEIGSGHQQYPVFHNATITALPWT